MNGDELDAGRRREATLHLRIADLEEQVRGLEAIRQGGGPRLTDRVRLAQERARARLRELSSPAKAGGLGEVEPAAQEARLRVLIVELAVPASDRDAGGLRMTWMMRLLRSLGCAVTLFTTDRRRREPYASQLEQLGIEIVADGRSFERFAQARRGLYELVLMSRPYVAEPLFAPARAAFPDAMLVYDTVDLHFVRTARRRELLGTPPDPYEVRDEEIELECIRRSDVTATVSDEEARQVQRRVPAARTVVLPTVHEVGTFSGLPFDRRADLLFIGNFIHDPNVDAVLDFASVVLPRITREIDVKFWILGQCPPAEVRALQSPSVVVTGFVPHVEEYFQRARVFVAPLRYGAGVKGKNGQAMASGLPLVTTSIGAEGMGLVDGRHALIRDDPEHFAQAVIDLYRERPLWEQLSHESQRLMQERWSPQAMRSRLEGLIEVLVEPVVTESAWSQHEA